jgi:hypothetical protein
MVDEIKTEISDLNITAKRMAGGEVVWFWTITAPYVPVELQPSNGTVASLGEAKAACRVKFDKGLECAKGLGHDVMWRGCKEGTNCNNRIVYF